MVEGFVPVAGVAGDRTVSVSWEMMSESTGLRQCIR